MRNVSWVGVRFTLSVSTVGAISSHRVENFSVQRSQNGKVVNAEPGVIGSSWVKALQKNSVRLLRACRCRGSQR